MPRKKTIVMQCCICGREKTEQGWQYRYRSKEDETTCSHGFCEQCYATEIMKIKMQTVMTTAPSYG